MKGFTLGAALLVMLLGVGCGEDENSESTAACTIQNCQAALDCSLGVSEGANFACRSIPVDERPEDDGYLQYCVDVCKAASAGKSFACYGEQADECRAAKDSRPFDPDLLEAALAPCVGSSGDSKQEEPAPACLEGCNATYEACTEQCSLEAWDACAPCANECGVALHACTSAC